MSSQNNNENAVMDLDGLEKLLVSGEHFIKSLSGTDMRRANVKGSLKQRAEQRARAK